MATVATPTTYEAPGRPDSLVQLKPRYENFIGGEWIPPTNGKYQENLSPVTGKAVLRGAALGARGHRPRARRRACRQGRLGRELERRARGRAERHRRRDRRAQGDARGGRDVGQRQAGARDPGGRHPAGGRPLPLLRRRDPRRGGLDLRARQGHGGLPLPRAAGRGRADHPVQLPAADGGLEDRPGPGRRQLHRREAGEPHAVVDPQVRRAAQGHRARRRAERRQRPGRRDRSRAGIQQADRQGGLHRARPSPAG